MDYKLRELEREAARGNPDASRRALVEHRRAGTHAVLIPTSILYDGTEAGLKTQPALDFRKLLRTHTFTNHSMGELDLCFRLFESVKFCSDIDISIQASYYHYCTPRQTLNDINAYTSWEISFYRPFSVEQTDEVIADPRFESGGILFDFPHQDVFSHYDSVAGRVPTEKIQDMVDFLRARFGLAV
jgi:hypothetical protein